MCGHRWESDGKAKERSEERNFGLVQWGGEEESKNGKKKVLGNEKREREGKEQEKTVGEKEMVNLRVKGKEKM